MPAEQLLTSSIEGALNKLLSLDDTAHERMAKLMDKKVIISLSEFSFDLGFQFHHSITVMALVRDESVIESCDCKISTDISTLVELRDISLLTKLIKEDRLALQGDIQAAQQFANLLKELNIDWEEQLAKSTGDVIAYNAFRAANWVKSSFEQLLSTGAQVIRDGAIEEKRVAAPQMLVDDFVETVFDIQAQCDSLEARIQKLEANR